mgnify:CR=1 FL=1
MLFRSYDLYVRNSIENIINKLNFTAAFFGYAKFKNYQYEFFQSEKNEDLVGELKNLRKTREQEEKNIEIDNILNANNLDKDEYLEKCMKICRPPRGGVYIPFPVLVRPWGRVKEGEYQT